ncbi:uncharacterized protein [Macaca fascicularis]|uniref:uncharacterized protein n=1 Tax=Macaca fascicularis TaxID=9541 RepID=UPI003D15C0E0
MGAHGPPGDEGCGLTGVAPPVGGVGYKGSNRPGRHAAPRKGLGAPCHFPALLRLQSRQRGEAEPRQRHRAVRPVVAAMTVAPDRLTFGALPSGDEGKMSLSGFKAKLKLLASIFHKNQDPPPQLTLHCNIKEKLTMKRDSLREEKLECSLWCCSSDPSPQGRAGRCCVLERRIVPWLLQKIVLKDNASSEPRKPSISSAIEVVDM